MFETLVAQLLAWSLKIKNQTQPKGNTETLVGGLFEQIVALIKRLIATIVNMSIGWLWKESVDTFSELTTKYPNPSIGWACLVKDENIIYVWDGLEWINTGLTVFSQDVALKKDLETKADKTFIYNLSQLANWYSYQNKADARQYIPTEYRGYGQIVTYQLSSGIWVLEQYLGNYGDNLDDWLSDETKWVDLKDFALKDEVKTKVDRSQIYNISQTQNWYQYQSKADARQYLPNEYRGYGQIVVYQLSWGEWVLEQYLGTYGDAVENWQNDETKWIDLKTFATKKELETKADKTFIYNLSQLANWYSYQNKADARKYIPTEYRGYGQIITYQLSSGVWILEQYLGNYGDNLDDWLSDETKWRSLNPASNKFQGKRMVWYGTSIPANLYPEMVGEILGAEVYNESYPSSCARRGTINYDDGIGLKGEGWTISWALSQTLAEKEEIINNWDYWKTKFVGDVPDTLDEDQKNVIRWSTFENKIARYLLGGAIGEVDYYVFDHGHNDAFESDTDEELTMIPADPYDRNYYIGAMNFLIRYIYQHNPRAEIRIIGHYTNDIKGTSRANLICKAQEVIAQYWGLPLCKVWEKAGFSATPTITTNGYWDANGIWHDTGFDGTNNVSSNLTGNDQNPRQENDVWVHDLTPKQIWMRDDLHPHTDLCRMHIAKIIASWMLSNAW